MPQGGAPAHLPFDPVLATSLTLAALILSGG